MEENKEAIKELKEKLLLKRKNAIYNMSDEELADCDKFCEDYKDFMNRSKIEREAVIYSIDLLKKNGYVEYKKGMKLKAGDKIYRNNRDKAILMAVIGKAPIEEGVRLCAAHIDSPRLDLKQNPLYEDNEIALFKTHYYGGIKKYQWTTIPLALHGVVVKADGTRLNVTIGEDENDPVFCVTDLLPHLATAQMQKPLAKGITGEQLNIVIGSRPFKDDEESGSVKLNIMNILFEKYGITEADFISSELEAVPAFKAKDIGFDRSMIGAYGHDDKVCAYTALRATVDCKDPEHTVVTVLTDKEETGSDGNTGLCSAYLEYFIADIAEDMAEIGVDIWQGVIPDNNISELQNRLKGSMVLMGGINSAIDRKDWDETEVRKETRSVCEAYGPAGAFIPCLTYGGPTSIFPGVIDTIVDEIHRYNRDTYGIG